MIEPNKKVFSDNLKSLMKKKGVTATVVCSELGFPMSTFSDWVKGKSYPPIGRIEKLANYFGVKKSELIEDKSIYSPFMAEDIFAGIGEMVAKECGKYRIDVEKTLEYYEQIINLYLDEDELSEVANFAKFVKNRDEKKDKQD